jgi:hypothetical protein
LYPLLPENVEIDRAENGELFYTYHAYTDEFPVSMIKISFFSATKFCTFPASASMAW